MAENLSRLLLLGAGIYLALGGAVALLFLIRWRPHFDAATAQGNWAFCLAVTPGVILLWPVIWRKAHSAMAGKPPAGEAESPVSPRALRARHGFAIWTLLIVGIALFAAALGTRQSSFPSVPATAPAGLTP